MQKTSPKTNNKLILNNSSNLVSNFSNKTENDDMSNRQGNNNKWFKDYLKIVENPVSKYKEPNTDKLDLFNSNITGNTNPDKQHLKAATERKGSNGTSNNTKTVLKKIKPFDKEQKKQQPMELYHNEMMARGMNTNSLNMKSNRAPSSPHKPNVFRMTPSNIRKEASSVENRKEYTPSSNNKFTNHMAENYPNEFNSNISDYNKYMSLKANEFRDYEKNKKKLKKIAIMNKNGNNMNTDTSNMLYNKFDFLNSPSRYPITLITLALTS